MRLPQWTRRVPVDAVAFVAIAVVIVASHVHHVRHGMCFDDPSWYFHFGKRTLAGDVPYRDYIFQVGPLPIYVDAAFQGLFGARYVASLYAAMFITILRVFVMWMLVRRVAGWKAGVLITAFCSVAPIFAVQHNWSTPYAQLFIVTSGLFFVLASRADGRRELAYLGLAGASAALVVTARQSSAMMIALVLFVATAILLARKEYFTRRRFVALWGGFAAGLVLVFGLLAIAGALGPAIEQMFLDAPQKKGIHGLAAVLDAISGGALVDGSFRHWWTAFLFWLGLPSIVVASSMYALSRDREISPGTLGMLAVPFLLLLGLFQQYASLSFISDLPRTFLTATVAVAVLFPDRVRRWFGLEPLVAIGLGALPLAADWATEMSFPGRGWGDAPSLVTGAILVTLASARLTERVKAATCAALAMLGLVHVVVCWRARTNPYAQMDSADGTLRDNRHGSKNPVLRGMRISEARKQAVAWLTSQVTPGSTCFVYGNNPVLYDVLQCTNPTRIDSTAADFITAADAEAAAAALLARPPDFIVAHEQAWMNPPLETDHEGKLERYDGLNPPASRAMHMGLRAILGRYESVGVIAEVIGPELAKFAAIQRDHIGAIRVYRRKGSI